MGGGGCGVGGCVSKDLPLQKGAEKGFSHAEVRGAHQVLRYFLHRMLKFKPCKRGDGRKSVQPFKGGAGEVLLCLKEGGGGGVAAQTFQIHDIPILKPLPVINDRYR